MSYIWHDQEHICLLYIVWCEIAIKLFLSSSTEDQHSKRGREALLLPPLHLCCWHGKHPPCLQRLSRHHPEDAPATVRAVVMGEERCSAKKKNAKTDRTMKHPEPWVSELPSLPKRCASSCEGQKTHTYTHVHTLTWNTLWSQNFPWCKLPTCSRSFDGWWVTQERTLISNTTFSHTPSSSPLEHHALSPHT